MIGEKLNDIPENYTPPEQNIPGTYPYKKRNPLPEEVHPETDNESCNNCGTCVDICPTNAISINPTIQAVKERLFLNCSERKEPVFFVWYRVNRIMSD